MEKILVVLNPSDPSPELIRFAARTARLSRSPLTALAVEQVFYEYLPLSGDMPYLPVNEIAPARQTSKLIDASVRRFLDVCQSEQVTPLVVRARGAAVAEVVRESRYADLLILDPATEFLEAERSLVSQFTREVLSLSECPVLVATEKVKEINEIVFCYDGTASAVYAMKQFMSLLPGYHGQPAILLEVRRNRSHEDEEHQRVMDLLQTHFDEVRYEVLDGDPKESLFRYFFMKQHSLIVMGAYGRGQLSRLFHPSTANILLRSVDLPLFITHF
jgi:nucleotide-binding universal stress UspA family protein